eukprot:GABV01009197.1.p1 GENE.GABV01009197.1~~GABV01009197.1.p1  ORF type:complete len:196 (-),score=45.63 GABV01009197.1:19-606(-)
MDPTRAKWASCVLVTRSEMKFLVSGVNMEDTRVDATPVEPAHLVSQEQALRYHQVKLIDPVTGEPCDVRVEDKEWRRRRLPPSLRDPDNPYSPIRRPDRFSLISGSLVPWSDWGKRDREKLLSTPAGPLDTPRVVAREVTFDWLWDSGYFSSGFRSNAKRRRVLQRNEDRIKFYTEQLGEAEVADSLKKGHGEYS